jgi:Tetracyclin repressor-like, C-terminal domain
VCSESLSASALPPPDRRQKFTPTLMLASDRFLAQLVLNNILERDVPGMPEGRGQPKVSTFAPYSGDISSCRAPVSERLKRHSKTDSRIELRVVRLAADGVWLERIMNAKSKNLKGVEEYLIEMTRIR